ncbi:MAG: diphthine synthase, partial [Candidatus Nanoarchaeia archaeon]
QKINAHTLILVDMGLNIKDALEQLKEASKNQKLKLDKIIVCSNLGTKYQKIVYGSVDEVKEIRIGVPFSFIIPSKLHFMEKEVLEGFSKS